MGIELASIRAMRHRHFSARMLTGRVLCASITILLVFSSVPSSPSCFAADPTMPSRRLSNGELLSLGSPKDKDRNHGVYGAEFSPNGAFLATRSTDAKIRIWNAVTGKQLAEFEPYQKARISDFVFSRDNKMVATVSDLSEEPATLWDIKNGKAVRKWNCSGQFIQRNDHDGGFRVIDGLIINKVSPGNRKVLPLQIDAGNWNVVDFFFAKPWSQNDWPKRSAIGFDLRLAGQSIRFWIRDFKSNRIAYSFGNSLTGLRPVGSFSTSGRYAAVGTGNDSRVMIADLANPELRRTMDMRVNGIDCVAFSPDNRHLVVARRDGSLALVETLTQTLIVEVPCIGERAFCASFSPDGRRLVTGHSGSAENRAVVWDFQEMFLQTLRDKSKTGLDQAMKSLAEAEPRRAYSAIAQLVEKPEAAIELIKDALNLGSKKPADVSGFEKYVADLDSSEFLVREAALEKLLQMRRQTKDRLERALEDAVSLEARIRLQQILELKESTIPGEGSNLAQRRALRSIFLLELIGSMEARELLMKLSRAEVDLEIAIAAKFAITRLR